MNTKPFIIALTGASASGKSYVADTIVNVADDFLNEGIPFKPTPFQKYTTREYRANELSRRQRGKFVDVISVDDIPSKCDLIYRTYGKNYGLETKQLQLEMDNGQSPIVVINDVRAVEELKKVFNGRILSLFLFRHVPNFEEIKIETEKRGNISERELMDRYIKATSLYRIYIENITVFDRVILNVKNEQEDEHNCTRLQVYNILKGIFNNVISLERKKPKGAKLFIISGNNTSGKDDVNRAVQRMGKLQAEVVPKYTSRRQEEDDESEMICQFIPRIDLIKEYESDYKKEYAEVTATYKQSIPNSFIADCKNKYSPLENETFQDYYTVQWDIKRLKTLRSLLKPFGRFWRAQNDEERFFQKNDEYINLDQMQQNSIPCNPKENDESCFLNIHDGAEYMIYENHGKQIKYAFTIDDLHTRMKNDEKHRVIVASLVNAFDYCKNKIGNESVIPIFSYSQISKEDYDKQAESEIEKLKSKSYDDLIRYSTNIVDFDHVIIYAETEMQKKGKSGGQKEELIDQMFRLFRAYNK